MLNREVTLRAIVHTQEVVESQSPNLGTVTAEDIWPDMEGLDYRDTVTDFSLPEGTFFDCAVVHLLTTATLDRLRVLYPQGRFEVRRFRPNVVVETANDSNDFIENAWIGQVLAIGDAVRLSITGPCPRCVMTTLPQGDLPKDAGILRTAAQHNRANVGSTPLCCRVAKSAVVTPSGWSRPTPSACGGRPALKRMALLSMTKCTKNNDDMCRCRKLEALIIPYKASFRPLNGGFA